MSFFILSPELFAQDNSSSINRHGIGFGIGQTFLMGPFEKRGDNKITTDIFYTYVASYSFDLLLGYHNSNHTYKKKEVNVQGYTINIKGRYLEFDNFAPFILAGVGFYSPEIYNGEEWTEKKTTFGLNLGIGGDLKLNDHIVVGLLGQLHKPFDVKQDEFPSVKGHYFKLLLTMSYLF